MNESGTASCAPESPVSMTVAPRTIGRYAIEGRLGAGGMGVVWAAHDPELNRKVAIKVLRAGSGTESDRRGQIRLVREAQAMARLSHPNVVQVHDAGVDGDDVYVAMELVVGMTAAQWLEVESRSWREVVRLFVQAGRGLAAAHAVGLVHRDFKPSNVLVAEDGRVRVADFGLASSAGGQAVDAALGAGSATASTELTSRGSMIGTPRYMAPEQRRGETAGPAADQFSFCVALHEALFGARPYPSASKDRRELTEADYQPPRDTLGVPRVVIDAVRRGLRIDPDERFPDLEALLARIERAPGALRRRVQLGLFGGAAIGLGALGWAFAADSPACDTSEVSMAEVWNDARRSNVAGILGGDRAAAVVAGLDRYTQDWVESGRQACEAKRDGALTASLHEASVTCLEDRRQALGRYLTLVEGGDDRTLGSAAVAATKLPSVADCRDTKALEAGLSADADPALRQTAEALRRRAMLAAVSHHSGRIDAALAELDAVSTEAAATDYAPIIAETSLASGRLAMDRQDWSQAYADLVEASSRALASGRDRIAAEAEARLIFVEPQLEDDPLRALEHERLASALIQRAGEPAWLRALLQNNVGVVHAYMGEREVAAEHFRRALDLSATAQRVDALDRASYAFNLAQLTADPDARDALFERTANEVEAALGRSHYQWLDHVVTWARYTADPGAALQRLQPVCPQLVGRAHDDPMRAYQCFARQAALHDALGQPNEALGAARQAAEALSGVEDQPTAAFGLKAQAYVALFAGDPEAAIERAREATEIFEPERRTPWVAETLAELVVLTARAREGLEGPNLPAVRVAIEDLKRAAASTEDRAPYLHLAQAEALLRRWSSP